MIDEYIKKSDVLNMLRQYAKDEHAVKKYREQAAIETAIYKIYHMKAEPVIPIMGGPQE